MSEQELVGKLAPDDERESKPESAPEPALQPAYTPEPTPSPTNDAVSAASDPVEMRFGATAVGMWDFFLVLFGMPVAVTSL